MTTAILLACWAYALTWVAIAVYFLCKTPAKRLVQVRPGVVLNMLTILIINMVITGITTIVVIDSFQINEPYVAVCPSELPCE